MQERGIPVATKFLFRHSIPVFTRRKCCTAGCLRHGFERVAHGEFLYLHDDSPSRRKEVQRVRLGEHDPSTSALLTEDYRRWLTSPLDFELIVCRPICGLQMVHS